MNSRLHVVVGILFNSNKDKILISKRTEKSELSDFWEFPGGKVESNEVPFSALNREFTEELGVDIKKAVRLVEINHDYVETKVLLDVWIINEYEGEPIALEGQEIEWSRIDNLSNYRFLEANKHIMQTLFLPEIYGISNQSYSNLSKLYSDAKNYFSRGLKIFQLRLKLEKDNELIKEVKKLSIEAKKHGAKLILNGNASDVECFSVDGIHLKSREIFNYTSRPISSDYILGASCHDESEIHHAIKLNVNYIVISPVLNTNSHPKDRALGWDKFKELTVHANIPVYALGGLLHSDLKLAKENGAYGIAMITALNDLYC